MKYPVVTTNPAVFQVNPDFSIQPQININLVIDGYPVVTGFNWYNKRSETSGTFMGQSKSLTADKFPVVLLDEKASVFYVLVGLPTVLSD